MGKITGHLYKVGDKLRITQNAFEYVKGDIVEVTEIHAQEHSSFDYRIKQVVSGRTGYVAESFVELVEPAFKKGDKIRNKNGSTFSNGKMVATVNRPHDNGNGVWLEDTGTWVFYGDIEKVPTGGIFTGDLQIGGTTIKRVNGGVAFTTPTDNVNNPAHYTQGGIETLDFIKAKLTKEAYKGFLQANIIKYVTRYEHKNGVEDLQKAEFYLRELIKVNKEA